MYGGGCVYIRGPSKRKRTGLEIVPESFWTRFGPDTAVVDTNCRPPAITTYAELGRRKRERQAEQLARKRVSDWDTQIRPLYVWVFHCPGLGKVAFRGWRTYLIGRGIKEGRWLFCSAGIQHRLMRLFPIAQGSLDDPPLTYEQWMPLFAKFFCCRRPDGTPRKHAGRIQGKALIWAEVCGGNVHRIIGQAQLPERRSGHHG
jgi:hypothetical protein